MAPRAIVLVIILLTEAMITSVLPSLNNMTYIYLYVGLKMFLWMIIVLLLRIEGHLRALSNQMARFHLLSGVPGAEEGTEEEKVDDSR